MLKLLFQTHSGLAGCVIERYHAMVIKSYVHKWAESANRKQSAKMMDAGLKILSLVGKCNQPKIG